MIEEIWKPVKTFEGYYEVSNLGNVRSCTRYINHSSGSSKVLHKGKILSKIIASTRGYYQVSLSKEGKTYKVYVHRIVAEAFIEGSGETVNHIDGNKLNNVVSNLEWLSYSDNNKHAFRIGLKVNKKGKRK